MKYISDRVFKIWAYTVSHSFLLLRSPMMFPDIEGYSELTNYNIDVEFIAVTYLDIPNKLKGITISEIKNEVPEKFKQYSDSLGLKVFEINSEGTAYYIVAGGYRIGKDHWVSEDRVSNPSLNYDEILATS